MSVRGWTWSLVVSMILVVVAALVAVPRGEAAPSQATQEDFAVVAAFNRAREDCYAAPECPNLDQYMEMFTADARRTEIQRNNSVVILESADALRADAQRVASNFTGRRLETTSMLAQGRNVIVQQLNLNPGAATSDPFTHVFRVQDGKIAHWVLVAP